MKKINIRIATFALCLIILFVCSATALATGSTVTYDSNADKFVFVPENTDLFQNFSGVMPGDVLTQDISIKNDLSNGVKVKIYLRAEPVQEQYKKFLSQMTLVAQQQENSTLFSAPADQQGELSTNVCLGTFYSGAEVKLNVSLNVPHQMDNEFQDAVGEIKWIFTAEELPIEPTDPTPKTGDTSNVEIYFVLAGVSIVALLILWLMKNRQQLKNKQH